jgi:hypothetical protein
MIVSATGALMSAGFIASLIVAGIESKTLSPHFWSMVTAGEIAAWRLKWIALPVAIVALWSGPRLIRSIEKASGVFAGLRVARLGLAASIMVIALIATLIGITIPDRLRHRQMAIDAGFYARIFTIHRALLEYRGAHGTFPAELGELKEMPDADGSIAEALRNIDVIGYTPGAVLASASTKAKPQALRGGAFRNVAVRANADLLTDHGVPFTNYDLRLPGDDKVFNVRDGFIMDTSELPASTSTAGRTTAP